MQHFSYRDGVFHAEDVDLAAIARSVGTPFYCYSTAAIEGHFKQFAAAFADQNALVCYAMKANSNQAVLKTLAGLGAGMDVVSEGELRRARAAGVPGERIIFSGVGKTRAEMALGLDEGICASTSNRSRSWRRSPPSPSTRGMVAPIAIRVNPDVDARTHAKIATGKAENKFGVPISRAREVFARASAMPGLMVRGVDMHIGSQIIDLGPSTTPSRCWPISYGPCERTARQIEHIDLGGGLGVPYRRGSNPPPAPDRYAEIVSRNTRGLDCKLYPGAGPPHRRQRGSACGLGHFRQAGRSQELRHCRRGNERSRASDALRRPS